MAFGSAKIPLGIVVTHAGIFEGRFAVECLPPLFELEGFVAIVWTGVAGVIDVAEDFDLYTTERVDDSFEPIKINRREVVNGESGDDSDTLAHELCPLMTHQAVLVEGVEFDGSGGIGEWSKEVAWQRQERYFSLRRIEREYHDGVGEVFAWVALPSSAEEEDVDTAFLFAGQTIIGSEEALTDQADSFKERER